MLNIVFNYFIWIIYIFVNWGIYVNVKIMIVKYVCKKCVYFEREEDFGIYLFEF